MKFRQYLQEKIMYKKNVTFLPVTVMPSTRKAAAFIDDKNKVYVIFDSLNDIESWEDNFGKTEKADFQIVKDEFSEENKTRTIETKEHGVVPLVNISTVRYKKEIDGEEEEKIDL